MSQVSTNHDHSRSWQVIARELARETNRWRVQELSQELNRALEEQPHQRSSETESHPARQETNL